MNQRLTSFLCYSVTRKFVLRIWFWNGRFEFRITLCYSYHFFCQLLGPLWIICLNRASHKHITPPYPYSWGIFEVVTLVVGIGRAVPLSLLAAPQCGSDRSEADLTLLRERGKQGRRRRKYTGEEKRNIKLTIYFIQACNSKFSRRDYQRTR